MNEEYLNFFGVCITVSVIHWTVPYLSCMAKLRDQTHIFVVLLEISLKNMKILLISSLLFYNNYKMNEEYTHNWPLQYVCQDYALASYTTYVVCVKLILWTTNFWETFLWLVYLLVEYLPESCWKKVAEEILSVFSFWCLTWYTNLCFTSNKPTHY